MRKINRKKRKSSQYIGVTFDRQKGTWRARISHNDKMKSAGSYDDELTAARAVNAKCMELAIPMKNPNIPLPLTIDLSVKRIRRSKKKIWASRYLGVYLKNEGWSAQINHNGQNIYIGRFGTETE